MTQEFKGTPGEWQNEGGDNASIDIILPNDAVVSISRYSRFTSEFVMDRQEMQANAHLIAAAPDMLEACMKLKDLIEKTSPEGQYTKELQAARAAISKALNK